MRKLLLIGILFLASSSAWSQKFHFDYDKEYSAILARTKIADDPFNYDRLLKRFRADDSTLNSYEILCLEIGFTGTAAYKPYEIIPSEDRIYVLNDAKKYKQAVATGDSLLSHYPLSQKALAEMAYAWYNLGNNDSVTYYSDLFTKMMDCIFYGADGTDAETAYFIIGPDDGQNFIRKYIRGKIGNTATGANKNGDTLTILQYLPKTESKANPTTLYFNIQLAVNTKK